MLKKFAYFLGASLLILSIVLFSCAPEEGGNREENKAPDTFILNVPPESPDSTIGEFQIPHDGEIVWNGNDPDGMVVGYFWRVTYDMADGNTIVTAWTFSERPETNVAFYAPDTIQSYRTVFEVAAIDQSGDGQYNSSVEFPLGLNDEGFMIPEPFEDINGDGIWNDDIAEPWDDNNFNGQADPGEFLDINSNNSWDEHVPENYIDLGAIDPTPAMRVFFTQNHPPYSLEITTQPPDWAAENTRFDPKYILPELTRIWDGLSFVWICLDEDDEEFPLSFQWELQKKLEDDEWVWWRRTREWLTASVDTPNNEDVIFTLESTYNQMGEYIVEYSSEIVEVNGDGFMETGDYRLIVWGRDASWGLSEADTSEFSVVVPAWVNDQAKDLLIVDETDANHTFLRGFQGALYPEEDIDNFYDNLFIANGLTKDVDFDVFEYSVGGEADVAPTKWDFANYKTVFWYSDDGSPMLDEQKLDFNEDGADDVDLDELLEDYMEVGGNVILSGWQLIQAFSGTNGLDNGTYTNIDPEFNFFRIDEYQKDTSNANGGEFIGVKGRDPLFLPDIDIYENKVQNHVLFSNVLALPAVGVYKPAPIVDDPFIVEIYYRFNSRNNFPLLDNENFVTCMAYKTDTFNSALIGFPLFLMDDSQGSVTELIGQILEFFDTPYEAPE